MAQSFSIVFLVAPNDREQSHTCPKRFLTGSLFQSSNFNSVNETFEHLQDMPLWKRTYKCPKCGLVMDRDENSAINILTRYLARLGPHTPSECGVLQEDGLDVEVTGASQVA